MDEMLKKQDVLDAIYAKMEKTDKPDVVLGLAAAMSTVKQMQAVPVTPAEKQEPSYNSVKTELDCVSRQAVLMEVDKYLCGVPFEEKGIDKVIKELPPVTPAEKVGHWIDHQEDRWIYAKCSECETIHDSRTNYCPNCGAKMGGEQNE